MFWDSTNIIERVKKYQEKIRNRKIGLGLFALFAISVITLSVSEVQGYPSPNIAAGIASTLLSFMLVVLYWQQYEIMSDQEELMRASQSPIIDVSMLRPYSIDQNTGRESHNNIQVTLENVGEGVAISPYIKVDGSIDADSVEMVPAYSLLAPTSSEGDHLDWGGLDSTVRAGGSKTYATPIMARINVEGEETESDYLSNAIRKAHNNGARDIVLEFYISVDDSVGDEHISKILHLEFDVKENLLNGFQTDSDDELNLLDIFIAGLGNTAAAQMTDNGTIVRDDWSQKGDILARNAVENYVKANLLENLYDDDE